MQKFLSLLICIYQKTLSRYLKSQCKFHPTCSEYAILSIKKYGALRGSLKAISRLARCNPFSLGDIDFP
ncbi:MAG: membrane protein insertion efficiency factor YidD [Holosporaceae bacterium]|nr:membrane protein insertion efficiency factor YidD [Holosporaceae bacterium]